MISAIMRIKAGYSTYAILVPIKLVTVSNLVVVRDTGVWSCKI